MRSNKKCYSMATGWKHISPLLQQLKMLSSPIPVLGDNVKVLYSPQQFFTALKEGVGGAKERVILSSLYLGTQKREQELVDVLRDSLSVQPKLECSLLLDYLRGSRGSPNSRTVLQPLVNNYADRVKVHLYHTPNLRGWLKWAGPPRFNEVMGLQHMKIYIFDNDLILSGANLSRDYFVDRQDRYTWFKDCPQLTDYFADLVHTVASHSFTLNPQGLTEKPTAVAVDPLSSRIAAQQFRTSLSQSVTELIQALASKCNHEEELNDAGNDTLVFPLLQMGCYGIRQDEECIEQLFRDLSDGERQCLASGYFNLPHKYVEAILQGRGHTDILAASPQANGFYGGSGVAGHVPAMYVHFAHQFLRRVASLCAEDRVRYMEYTREAWTFHGKGLWLYPAGEEFPVLSLMGSSNYGHRSLTRDLEAQVAIVTTNQCLRESLHQEKTRIFDYGKYVSLSDASSDVSRKLTILEWLATTILKPHV